MLCPWNNICSFRKAFAGMLLAKEIEVKSLMAKSDSMLVTGYVTGEYQANDPQMAAYLQYVLILKNTFAVFELVHVSQEQNTRANLLAKFVSSGKEGRQRTIIQETLRKPRTTTDDAAEVQQISTSKNVKRSHRSLTQETLKTPRISTYMLPGEESTQVCLVEGGETWMTPYQRYLAYGILPL